MLKLNVGASRKVTDNNYGSRGASINLELELDTSLAGDPDRLRDRIRQLFDRARTSLTEELRHGSDVVVSPALLPASGPTTEAADTTTTSREPRRSDSGQRRATPSQIKALHAIARQHGVDLTDFLRDRFQVFRADDLLLRQASRAIDDLRALRAA